VLIAALRGDFRAGCPLGAKTFAPEELFARD
jgi:hypothetical protein